MGWDPITIWLSRERLLVDEESVVTTCVGKKECEAPRKKDWMLGHMTTIAEEKHKWRLSCLCPSQSDTVLPFVTVESRGMG
ncbi:hypothetical protein Baya_13914 [Bagarius yarrelli]|uniref:Uncharacterized protein n=1 Tax=Bagarius yarrelli TaxID=175774 RepID=A0A556V7M1_BAGYA|nr:hypothetical protein Baya_13914 [Bagarius yarrelli]